MYYPVYRIVHIDDSLLLIEKSSADFDDIHNPISDVPIKHIFPFFSSFQTKSQRDRETKEGQDELLYFRTDHLDPDV